MEFVKAVLWIHFSGVKQFYKCSLDDQIIFIHFEYCGVCIYLFQCK